VTLHIEPVPAPLAARRLRQQQARLESTRALDADHGHLADPHTDTAAADAEDLATRLARGETRLHRLGLYLTVHAPTEHDLARQLHAVRAVASSMLLDARPTTYRALQAWTTTLPIGIDALARRRVMDTDALASTVPATSMELPAADPVTTRPPSGVLYGHNLATGGLVIHDRFAAPNHNAVILASSGAGKSYVAKLELLRSLYRGIEVIVIDPEDEYARLARQVGGTHLRLGSPDVRINPLDLPHPPQPADHGFTRGAPGATVPGSPQAGGDVLTRRALYMHTVLGVLLGELTSHERVLADRAIHTAYTGAGITTDSTTWTRPAPILADLAAAFTGLGDPVATDLADRLTPFVAGSYRALFDGPTTIAPSGHLVVFSLKDLPEQLRAIGTLTALDATWRTITNPHIRRPRLVVVDEAWLLLQHRTGAEFLLRLAKAARKHWAGLTLITQDAGDLLASDLGRAVISNAATHILLRTAPHAAPRIAREYQLTDAERDYLTTATTGTGLLLTHTGHHIPFTAQASHQEDLLATTNPAQLAALAAQRADTTPSDTDTEHAGTAGSLGFAGRQPVGLNDDEADPL
jgi:type IV secretory pathway VirB4 component